MIWRNFYLGILIRLVLLLIVMGAFAYVFMRLNYFFTQLVLGSIVIGLSIELFNYVIRVHHEVKRLMTALKHDDHSVRFSKLGRKTGLHDLQQGFEDVLKKPLAISETEDFDVHFLTILLDKVPIGLIMITEGDLIVNKVAKSLIGLEDNETRTSFLHRFPEFNEFMREVKPESKARYVMNNHELSLEKWIIQSSQTYEVVYISKAGNTQEDSEMDAWLKLIRILTHEIMNTATSMTSLSSTAYQLAIDLNSDQRIIEALASIKNRAGGMIEFVSAYRKMSHVPAPKKSWIKLADILTEQFNSIFGSSATLKFKGDTHIKVYADQSQIEQTVLNILLNAQHAMKNSGRPPAISVDIIQEGSLKRVQIKDNGKGIEPEQINDVFIPFFSTREEGSGIGLSLSRQIMRNHGGTISLSSKVNVGTTIELRFHN